MRIDRINQLVAVAGIDTNAYAAGDLVGGKLTLAGLLGVSQSGRVETVVVLDLNKADSALDVIFFNADPTHTTFTNNAAFDIDDQDLPKVIGHVPIATGDYCALSDNGFATHQCALSLQAAAGGGTVYAAVVSRGTPTFSADGDLSLVVSVARD